MSTPHREKNWASWLIPAAVAAVALLALGYWLWPRGEEKGQEFAKEETPAVRPADERETGAEGEPQITGHPIGDAAVPPGMAAHAATARNWMGDLGSLGNTELGREMTSTFTRLSETFASVRDSASAQDAKGKLRDVADSIERWEASLANLPDEAKGQFHQVIRRTLPSIESARDKAMAVPGEDEHLRPATDRILDKLRELSQEGQTGTRPAGS